MRRFPTSSEQVLWAALRGGRLGVRFVRQVALGPYIVDFLAPRQKPIVEVDGGYHAERASADERRQRWLEGQGYRVLRVSAGTVLHELEVALRSVARAIAGGE
jgi:very-short-patch-repair endonuclease